VRIHYAAQRLPHSLPALRVLLLQLLHTAKQLRSSNVCLAYGLYRQGRAAWAAAGVELQQYTFSPAAVQLSLLIFKHYKLLLLLLPLLAIQDRLLFGLLLCRLLLLLFW
jgi:hypothetical protein